MDENIAGMDVAVGAVGSEGERRSSVLSTAQDDGAVAALAPGQRWSLARKREVVLRLMQGEPVELSVTNQPGQGTPGHLGDYERLLGDAMAGDATLFARQDVVEAAWAIVDPVIHGPSPMFDYDPGTWGPVEADRLVQEVGGWNAPR